MSSLLHMDTEQVRSLASQIQQSLGEIESKLGLLAAELQALDWISPGRDQFQGDFTQVLRTVASLKQSGDELSTRLQSTVAHWETAAEWGAGGSGSTTPSTTGSDESTGAVGGGGGGGGGGAWGDPENAWNDAVTKFEEGALDVGDLAQVVQDLFDNGYLSGQNRLTLLVKMLKYCTDNELLQKSAQNADDILALKDLATVIITRGAQGNPAFSIAWVLMKHEAWTPYADKFAEEVSKLLNQGMNIFAQNIFPSAMDLVDVITIPMDQIMYPSTVTPQRQQKAQQMFQAISDFLGQFIPGK